MLASPTFQRGKAIFGLPKPSPRRPDIDELFIRSVQNAFPVVATRQLLPAEAPLQVPHLLLQSTASRLAVSAMGAELEVAFYGEFASNYKLCREYLRTKSITVIQGWAAATETVPSLFGIGLTLNFSFKATDTSPVRHLLEHHLRPGIAKPDDVQDAAAKLAVRVDDRYFINVTLSNYETKIVERPVFPGQVFQVKQWEGEVYDYGIAAELDINNRLMALEQHADPSVTAKEVDAMFELTDRTVGLAPNFVENGELRLPHQVQA